MHAALDPARRPGPSGGFTYQRRRPEIGTLYDIVRDNLQTLYATVEDGFAAPLPAFVRNELEQYLDCGLLCRGFARLECEKCHEQRLVAFSCKGRGFCPSCLGRRMAQTAANLVDHVLPVTPLRQFVITFPFELRARLAYDGKLLGAVTRIAIDSVLGFYKRRLRDEESVIGQSGAVSVVLRPFLGVMVQRTNEPHNIERLLLHLGEPIEPPRCAPPRDPPYFKSKATPGWQNERVAEAPPGT